MANRTTSGVILAGGQSSRMGRDKALLPIGEGTCIERLITLLTPLADQIIIAGGIRDYQYPGCSCIPDLMPGFGPLGGIYSALTHASQAKALVVACDLPNLNAPLLKHLVNEAKECEICIPRIGNQLHPLCGVYDRSITTQLKHYLLQGHRKVQEVITFFDLHTIPLSAETGFSPDLLVNMNTPAEYQVCLESEMR